MSEARPFKIWNSDRSVKKGTVAASLKDLLKRGELSAAEGLVNNCIHIYSKTCFLKVFGITM
jgi:hypothetical protein